MAKPYIASRLRNPNEEAAAKPQKAKSDIVGGIFAILAFGVAAATTAILYFDWDFFTIYLTK